MAVSDIKIKEISKEVVKESFFKFFLCRSDVQTRHILLYRMFPAESNIRSVMGGLETSLGTTLWERIAKRLAEENGFNVLDPKTEFLQPQHTPEPIRNLIAEYKDKREVPQAGVPMSDFTSKLNSLLLTMNQSDIPANYIKLTKGSGVDVFIRKGNVEYAFDLKTVQINAGAGTKFNETLMKWIAFRAIYQKHLSSKNTFNAHIVIPYDPHTDSDWWTEFGERAYPLDHTDIKLGDEFWDLLSGRSGTLKLITAAFDDLCNENFNEIYKNCFHQSGVKIGIELLVKIANVESLNADIPQDTKFTSKLNWKCKSCNSKFDASIKWFESIRSCKHCNATFFS
jgi:hypothetical protein